MCIEERLVCVSVRRERMEEVRITIVVEMEAMRIRRRMKLGRSERVDDMV